MAGLHIAALVAALGEEDDGVLCAALQQLHACVDECWADAADAVSLIEALSERPDFAGRELAASLASRIFFHLEAYDDALRLAFCAGAHFDVSARSEYVETLVSRCVDEYVAAAAAGAAVLPPGAPLEEVVSQMLARCCDDGQFRHAAGVALEARRLDRLDGVLKHCPAAQRPRLLADVATSGQVLAAGDFKSSLIRLLVQHHSSLEEPDYVFLGAAMQDLGLHKDGAAMLLGLAAGDERQGLLAVQLAFLFADAGDAQFAASVLADVEAMAVETEGFLNVDSASEAAVASALFPGKMAVAPASVEKLRSILKPDGVFASLKADFLRDFSDSDALILKTFKLAIDGNRNSVLHNALVVSHGFSNAGTASTQFLRDNLDWMAKASNWAKFTATASVGVVHAGHVGDATMLLRAYLPQGGASASPYSEGGALYALGLVHAARGGKSGDDHVSYLSDALRDAGTTEPLQHGAALGLGLAALGSADETLVEQLKTVLFFDAAVAGEAAAYGIGMLLAGRFTSAPVARSATAELLSYAHETAHEKIIRGVAMALALTVCGCEDAAEPLIEQLCRDRDAILRYGGMYAIGLAYAGTANDHAVKRLLGVAVADVSDDVRRAAVTCLGFVMFKSPERVPALVALLAESFNPHVRYGACLAVGIACAGTGAAAAQALLRPMVADAVDFVRQGALIAMAMVLMQTNSVACPAAAVFREKIAGIVKDKYPSTLTKLGAILAAGVVDAGGRNCCVSLESKGRLKVGACAGLALWAQHWFWHPMQHFFSLALSPSMVVGVTGALKIPRNFAVHCAAPPSKFAYPPKTKEQKEERKERVVAAVLSTTVGSRLRQQARDRAKGIGAPAPAAVVVVAAAPAPPEAASFDVQNPARMTRLQLPLCACAPGQRYVPLVASLLPAGVVILVDTRPGEAEDAVDAASRGDADAPMPEPFEWTPP